MNLMFLLRVALDFLAVGLFMVAMAYWWLDNRTHELVGTGMFALLFLHNVFNRRWYGRIPKTRLLPKPIVAVGLNIALLLVMATLFATSLLISRSLFEFTAVGDPFAKDIHILAAYWALIVISMHLGIHWPIIMGIARKMVGIRDNSLARAIVLRIVVVFLALAGIRSSFTLAVASRLLLVPTTEFWDFSEDVSGFFTRCVSIICFYAAVGHYSMISLQYVQKRWISKGGTASRGIGN